MLSRGEFNNACGQPVVEAGNYARRRFPAQAAGCKLMRKITQLAGEGWCRLQIRQST